MVFRLAERAKRVSVSQPDVADVLVVAPSQLLINGKGIGTTSLIIFDEKGEVTITAPLARHIEFKLPKPVAREVP